MTSVMLQARLWLAPKIRRDFEAAQRRRVLADEELDAFQFAALQSIWADAVTSVPYYRQSVTTGKAPRTLKDWQDFQSIPVLTRQTIQENPELFMRDSRPPQGFAVTAGSTGTPLRIGIDQSERDLMRIATVASRQPVGYSLDARLFLIWGHAHLLGTGWRGKLNHLRRKLADRILGYCRVDAYRMNPQSCRRYAAQLVRFRPTGLIGYASALDLFARNTASFRDQFRSLGMRFILATSEPPPRTDTFELLEDLFGCPVVQEYGGVEFGPAAFKPPGQPFEVFSDLNYIEADSVGDGESPGQPILLTALYPRYTPLIRYRVGDAVLRPTILPHGHIRSFEGLAGRVHDVVPLSDGDSLHSMSVFHCIHQERDVYNIQMVFHDEGVDLCLVTSEQCDRAGLEARVRSRLRQVHPELAQARFRYVDDLGTNRAGKRRWFVDLRSRPENR
uniref:Phenylacetate--CoA ligase family protein n=1 Tax=Schlesneria paludicola TaxID=360056 RepID=A0A7C2PEY3_9PLAN